MKEKDFIAALGPDKMLVQPGTEVTLKAFDAGYTGKFKKSAAKALLPTGIEQLASFQDMLYAQNIYALLLIFQAMDAAGKDSTIKLIDDGL